jgi:hypothetical protein
MGPFSEKRKAIEHALDMVFNALPPDPCYLSRQDPVRETWDCYRLLISFRNRCADEEK